MLLCSLINRGDGILLDEPCYPGTKGKFLNQAVSEKSRKISLKCRSAILAPLGAEMIGVETDRNGMDMKDLIKKINAAKSRGTNLKVSSNS